VTRLNATQQELVVRYMPLAKSMAKKTWTHVQDEALSEAYIALCKAAASFDPEMGIEFGYWAKRRIHGAIVDHQRKLYPKGFRTPGQRGLGPVTKQIANDRRGYNRVSSESHEMTLEVEEAVSVDHDGFQSVEDRDQECRYLKSLPRTHQRIFDLWAFQGRSGNEVARTVGLSQARVWVILQESRTILRGLHQKGHEHAGTGSQERSVDGRDASGVGSAVSLSDL
jgi:RNA polymerase sigma factor (sigma-70 family)